AAARDIRHLRALRTAPVDRAAPAAPLAWRTGPGCLKRMPAARRLEYLEAIGIDLWVPRAPEAAPPPAPAAAPAPAPVAAEAPPPAAMSAASAADVAARWEALRVEVLGCTRCPLHLTRTQGVLGVGPKRADWLVIGEAPGAEEDRRGEPFVGVAGQLLDAMLRAIGLD